MSPFPRYDYQELYIKENCHVCYFFQVNTAVTVESLIKFTVFSPEIVNLKEYF
jgi:hypothetical protein